MITDETVEYVANHVSLSINEIAKRLKIKPHEVRQAFDIYLFRIRTKQMQRPSTGLTKLTREEMLERKRQYNKNYYREQCTAKVVKEGD